ncbi:MAG: hypothetical protein UZ22_OP11002000481 [Microgenomates bacterium OLB23]|nr:MAG: hypothetical protein UZ22_OP11002000481 [Microgenomates bacterium OLB23]
MPSSRSIAFKRSAWRAIGGYPEQYDTCEDLVFAQRLKDRGMQFYLEKNAVVIWQQEKSIIAVAKQLFGYARGDGQALYVRPQTPLLFFRYLVGALLLGAGFYNVIFWQALAVLLVFYILWAIKKNYRYVQHISALFYLPLLQFISDAAVICGMIVGYAARI